MPEENYSRVYPFSRIPIIHPALFFDDCESTFIWRSFGDGADWTAEHDPSAAHVQTNGILLKTRATDPAINDKVTIYRTLWLPPSQLLRLQFCFSTIAADPLRILHVIIVWYDGAQKHYAGLELIGSDGTVQYISGWSAPNPVWTALEGWNFCFEGSCWNKVDLSLNITNHMYHLIHVNEHVLDGSAIPLASVDAVVSKYLHVEFVLTSTLFGPAEAWIDQVLLTPENP